MKTMLVLPGSRKPIEVTSPFVSEMQFCAAHNAASDVIEVNQCREANANLIAAGPDMYDALEQIANQTCDHGPQDICPREIAQAALSKARGGK